MNFIKAIFSADTIATLIATAVSGGIVYAATGWGFWASAMGGYLITELLSMANKIQEIRTDLAISSQRALEMEMKMARIEELVADARNEIADHRVIDHDT